MNDLTMLFCTCDAYIDLCDNFFALLKRYWPEYDGTVIFNSDKTNYHNDSYHLINVEHPYPNSSWSQRLFDSLKLVETEFVILFLDDFYLESKVNNSEFLKCLTYMKKHKNVKEIAFTKEPGIKRKKISELGDFSFRRHLSLYKITAHIAIYRTSFLKNILKRNENAWEFEVNGTFRSFFKKGSFICKTNDHFTFPYHYGLLVRQGKYDRGLKEYFEKKENLVFANRPFADECLPQKKKSKVKYFISGLKSFFSKRPL